MVHFNKVLGTKNVRRLIVCNYISIAALHSVKLVTEDDEDFVSRQMEREGEREKETLLLRACPCYDLMNSKMHF